jgi:hypothetical protein
MLVALYRSYVTDELKKLIPKDSFASYLIKSIGRELQATIEDLDEEDEGVWGAFPVEELYELLASGWNLDHEWFQYTDGIYRDDNEKEIPTSVPRTYSAVEQIAAYGLYWVSSDELNCMGQLPDEGINDQGWTREGILEHKAECLLRAYQALVCGQKLMIGKPPTFPATQEEIVKAARIAMARKAADALHNKPNGVRAKKAAVIAYWRENIGADKSNEFAAELLQKEFPDVAHRTLARYISEAKKLPPAGTQ